MKDYAHGTLISCTDILQSKRYYYVTVYPNGILNDLWFSSSGCILIWLYPKKSIHEGQLFDIRCVVNYAISNRQRKFVLKTGCIETTEINADPDLSIFLKYREDISNSVWVLLLSNEASFDEFMNFNFDCFHDIRSKPSLLLFNWFSIRFDIKMMHSH